MRKVYMLPKPSEAAQDVTNSINQIVLQLQKALPEFGYELTENEAEADLVAGHAGQTSGRSEVSVACVHGLYPTAQYHSPDWWYAANAWVTQNIRSAKEVTVPSQWVAHILERDMGLSPTVIPWAINPDEWTPVEQPGNYVLWNKTRSDAVCDPAPMIELAKVSHKQLFLSTFGDNPTPNVKVTGRVPFQEMKDYIRNAAIYLATTRETFGIGTLESMACGIPILGYRYGATADIVEHGVTGYLTEPGDIDGLQEGLAYCLAHREILGKNARKRALEYTWQRTAQLLAQVFDRALEPRTETVKVSVVIPCYNYARHLSDALKSVLSQETDFKFEVIVVDDGSTDNPEAVYKSLIRHYLDNNPSLEMTGFTSQQNQGVAATRNNGIRQSRGELIVCLDADDKLGSPHFLQLLADALDADRTLGIVYTGLTVMNEAGELSPNKNDWPGEFVFEQQIQKRNCVPTACMFRKEAWRRVGGYRANMSPAEDANLWLRITAAGYFAKQITQDGMFHYRLHDKSLSSDVRTGQKQEPVWNNFPYVKDGLMPFAATGKPQKYSYPVRNYDTPVVSVIIPVGKGHEKYLPEALDSVEYQTERNWECLVVNDTGQPLQLRGYAWAKILENKGTGAGAARNTGIEASIAPLVAFLDADDILHQEYLEHTLRAYRRTGRYAYTDFIGLSKANVMELNETPDYDCAEMFRKSSMHAITILMRKKDALKVGGFDESMLQGWEDTDFLLKLAAGGICGIRVPKALLMYRYLTGNLRETGETIKTDLKALLYERYKDFIEGREQCMCCNDNVMGKQGVFNGQAQAATNGDSEQLVRVEYQGAVAAHSVRGANSQRYYGYRARGDIFFILPADLRASPELFTALVSPEYDVPETVTPNAPELV